ncbi:MAG TPA: hypothetical protein VIM18_02610 [Solirubrobacteraceae bacterium]
MRPRFAVLGCALAASAVMSLPGIAGAAPRHNHGLTVNATPNPIIAGEGVLIYGQLKGTDIAGKAIVLFHHISGSGTGYSRIGSTTTDSHGFYEFTRAEGIVETNRSWFVRLAATPGVHSRTVHERVAALVSIAASSTTALTRHPVTFTGHVAPNHAFERVWLQEQIGSTDDWKTLKSGRLGPGSNYAISYSWKVAGEHTARVVFRGDNRNTRGESDAIAVAVQQAQVPDFTIQTSDPIITYGQSATISGTLYARGSTTPAPSTPITLCHRSVAQIVALCDMAGVTGSDGSYSFSVSPTSNQVYFAKTTLPPARRSAALFEGVKDTVTLTTGSSSVTAGQKVTFTGTVTPDKAGEFVYLQRLGTDGDWHTVGIARVSAESTFAFTRVFGTAGSKTFRARVPGDVRNVGGASPALSLTVSLPAVSTLPPAS